MFCKRWRPQELLPKVDLLQYLLKQCPGVVDVALTGSVARLEPEVHDIDLVIFHDGSLKDGCAQDPERMEPYYNNDINLAGAVGPEIARQLSQARMGVPVNYVFVEARVIFDCEYLRALGEQENFPEFYLRVFCDIPLVLLNPYYCHNIFREVFHDSEMFLIDGDLPRNNGYAHPGLLIRHTCESGCKPKQPWSECKKEILKRKGHWWHPFMSLIGR